MTFSFNEAQQAAVDARGSNVLVSAGAGSGKTTVLVEHIIQRLREGGDVQRLLVLTFTHAAADEMRSRIGQALSDMVEDHPDDLNYRRQAALVPQASIGTIHSFCLDMIREHYHVLGLPAGFRVASDQDVKTLRSEVLEEFLTEAYADPESGIIPLADAFGGVHDDRKLEEILLDLYEYSMSRPDPEAWLRESADRLTGDAGDYDRILTEKAKRDIMSAIDQFRAAERLLIGGMLPIVWQHTVSDDLAKAEDLLRAVDGKDLSARVAALEFPRLPSGKKQIREGMAPDAEFDEALMERFKDLRSKGKDLCKRFSLPAEEQEEDRERLSALAHALAELVIRFSGAFQEEKLRRGWIDYSDMEHMTLRLLEHEETAAELAASYDEVLVDEYQDINEVQDAIFRRLAENDLFAVGDVKQSIYRFRLAEPRLFLQKYDRYGKGEQGRRIDLNDNYRSHRSVINGANHIFRQIMRREVAEVEYDARAELTPGLETEGVLPEAWFIDTQASSTLDLSPLEAEATFIAGRIRALHEEGYAYREMAILMRSLKSRQDVLLARLRAEGIPVSAGGSGGWLESSEMMLILSLLQVVDNPRQDIPLAAVLRSPLFRFTEEELLEIRLKNKDASFYEALRLSDENWKVQRFLKQLSHWRRLAGEGDIPHLLLDIYHQGGLRYIAAALPDGKRREENLSSLYQMACRYQQNECAGLYRFLDLLEESRDREVPSLGELAPDAVYLMNIHKSKGLEFPVVFVAGCGNKFQFRDEYADVIWERSLGFGMRFADRKSRKKRSTVSHDAVAALLHEQALAEEMRICYVALTRAKERLILVGCSRTLAAQREEWQDLPPLSEPLPMHVLTDAKTALDWYGPALCRPHGEECWDVHFIDMAEICPGEQEETKEELPAVREDLQARVDAVLSWHYPDRDHCDDPAKWAVSALNRQKVREEEPLPVHRIARLSEEESRLAAVRGSAYHKALELTNLHRVGEADIFSQLKEMKDRKQLDEESFALVEGEKIAAFFRTELGQRMCAAEEVRREVPFTLMIEEGVLVQGVLDAAFSYEDGWVLLDYKTGGKGKSDEAIIQMYRQQLICYADAIRRLWNQPVKEVWLYMLDLDRAIFVEI